MPHYWLSQPAQQFVGYVYEAGWIEHDFDWGEWTITPEAVCPRDDPAPLAEATQEQRHRMRQGVSRQANRSKRKRFFPARTRRLGS